VLIQLSNCCPRYDKTIREIPLLNPNRTGHFSTADEFGKSILTEGMGFAKAIESNQRVEDWCYGHLPVFEKVTRSGSGLSKELRE